MKRIGITGFGFMGQFHYRAYQEIPGAKVAALFDFDPKVFDRAPIQGNIASGELEGLKEVPKFSDLDRFLAQDLDVIDICVPTFLHREIAERALGSGRAVLCEKPMALSLADCDAMIAASKKGGKLLMIAQCVRFWPGCDLLLAAARSGAYGRPLSATLRRIGGAPAWSGWFLDEKKSGGGILDCLVHDFDFARAAFGMPAEVTARGNAGELGPDSGVSYCRVDLSYPHGPACVTIEGGWMVGPGYPFSMAAYFQFQEATLAFGVEPGAQLAIYHRDGRKEIPALKEGQGYVWELRYFLECLVEGKNPDRCPPQESRDAIAMALAARDSVLSGATVRLKA